VQDCKITTPPSCADATITDGLSTISVPSGGAYTCTSGGAKDLFLKAVFATTTNTMETLIIDADNAGTYTSITDDGSSGTITLNINGGGFAAFVNPTVLAVSDTVVIKRTVATALGFVKLTGTYV